LYRHKIFCKKTILAGTQSQRFFFFFANLNIFYFRGISDSNSEISPN
jgi:hypothetical protein